MCIDPADLYPFIFHHASASVPYDVLCLTMLLMIWICRPCFVVHVDIAATALHNLCGLRRDTPLHVAAVSNNVQLATLLIEKKAELDPIGQDG